MINRNEIIALFGEKKRHKKKKTCTYNSQISRSRSVSKNVRPHFDVR
jgi:hypothetical protein